MNRKQESKGCGTDSNTESNRLLEYDQVMRRLASDVELFGEFVKIFREDAPQLTRRMETAIQESNAADLHSAAHALRGLISNFGATDVISLAKDLELAQVDASKQEAQEKMSELLSLIDQLNDELDQYFPRTSP
jgi:HPt (histidine-containing phosphotransfer) domain-containing protein